jgi:hypothetical protein
MRPGMRHGAAMLPLAKRPIRHQPQTVPGRNKMPAGKGQNAGVAARAAGRLPIRFLNRIVMDASRR